MILAVVLQDRVYAEVGLEWDKDMVQRFISGLERMRDRAQDGWIMRPGDC
jgi:hypothetical protein